MQQLTRNVFVETQVRGCNFGFVTTSDGIVMIDSPHKPSDALKLTAEIEKRGRPIRLFEKIGSTHKNLKIYDDPRGGGAIHCSHDYWAHNVPFMLDWLQKRL